jgi:hypothetical protein
MVLTSSLVLSVWVVVCVLLLLCHQQSQVHALHEQFPDPRKQILTYLHNNGCTNRLVHVLLDFTLYLKLWNNLSDVCDRLLTM